MRSVEDGVLGNRLSNLETSVPTVNPSNREASACVLSLLSYMGPEDVQTKMRDEFDPNFSRLVFRFGEQGLLCLDQA